MFQKTMRRSLSILALTLILVPSLTSAAPLFGRLDEFGRAAWGLLFGFGGGGQEHGCEIDPDGKPRCAPAPKHGCEIDPNGKPRCAPTPKHGCEIGPDGKPRCTP